MKSSESLKSSPSRPLQPKAEAAQAFFGGVREGRPIRRKPFFAAPLIQAKLTIGEPGDKYEQEADAMAERVTAMSEAPQSAAPAVQAKCAGCEQKEALLRQVMPEEKREEEPRLQAKTELRRQPEQEEEEPVQTKPDLQRQPEKKEEEKEPLQTKPELQRQVEKEEEEEAVQPKLQRQSEEEEEPIQAKSLMRKTTAGQSVASPALTAQLSQSKGSGRPLPASTQSFMGQAFGADFSGVRVHTDERAAEMNRGLQAKAFTYGGDVYFNRGQYSPESSEGKKLLGHELTHVVQQGGTGLKRNVFQPQIVQLSPLSDELSQIWNTQGKGVFYKMLRQYAPVDDPDLLALINTLNGDDLWLTQNIAKYGWERNWPIHLKVEREMKGWNDSDGKDRVFSLLRTANGAEAGNTDLSASINRFFAEGSDDLWLAANLQKYGVEANWPIHLRVEREMKGWADSGGKGVVFGILRAAKGTEAGNVNLARTLENVFHIGTQDLTLGLQLQVFGPEANFPANFANRFNEEFSSIMHIFQSDTRLLDEGGKPNGSSATQVLPVNITERKEDARRLETTHLKWLFTPTQREKLMSFMVNRVIPERLFTSDDIGNTTAQQRLLMSAHILANGNYSPGSFEQRVHARMCFHWVQIVHHYAGVTPAGILNAGVMGSFDTSGNIVLGAGTNQSVFFGQRVFAADLPPAEGTGIGPVPEGTGHAASAELEAQQRAGNPETRQQVHRRYAFPINRFNEIRPGDWLWYYNANRSASGSHSVIFSRWASNQSEVDGVPFRTAIAFSQGSPEAGGREHTVRLGEQFHRSGNISIYPITYISRVSENARPPSTVEELLPASPGRREQQLCTRNLRFLRQIERRYHRAVDLEQIKTHLRAENREHITNLSGRLTAGQQRLLAQANSQDNLETLIRLTERLRVLDTNAIILERNMAKTFDQGLTTRHADATRRRAEERQRLDDQIEEIDRQMGPIQAQIEAQNIQLAVLDLSPVIRSLQRKSGSIWRLLKNMKMHSSDYESLRKKRQRITDIIRELQNQQRSRRREVQQVRANIRQLQRHSRPLEQRRQRLLRQQNQRQSPLLYGLVHPGRLAGESRVAATGRLDKIFTVKGMRQFLR